MQININNRITCFEYCEANVLMSADNLSDALDVALAADDYCGPCEPCSYYESIVVPFGTDERQCELDAIPPVYPAYIPCTDDGLPF